MLMRIVRDRALHPLKPKVLSIIVPYDMMTQSIPDYTGKCD